MSANHFESQIAQVGWLGLFLGEGTGNEKNDCDYISFVFQLASLR